MAGYRLSGDARDDLLGIFFVGLEMFGYQQAELYRVGLEKAFALLAEYPEMARVREEIDGSVRALPHQAHVIVYEVDDRGEVLVLRIRHGHEDWVADTY